MEKKKSSLKNKISKAQDSAEKYEWLFYLVVISVLLPFRLGFVQINYDDSTGLILLDFIIAVNIIAFSTRLASTIRKKEIPRPYVICTNCERKINPPPKSKWKCVCGMELKFPPPQKDNNQKEQDFNNKKKSRK